jgi:hypothetical protein
VTRIVAACKTRYDIRFSRKKINSATFTLIAPLRAN